MDERQLSSFLGVRDGNRQFRETIVSQQFGNRWRFTQFSEPRLNGDFPGGHRADEYKRSTVGHCNSRFILEELRIRGPVNQRTSVKQQAGHGTSRRIGASNRLASSSSVNSKFSPIARRPAHWPPTRGRLSASYGTILAS